MKQIRYWPRGLSRKRLSVADYLKDLAPSVGRLRGWKVGKISWVEYERCYYQEMRQQREKIEELAITANSTTITLLCIEREDNPHCHRHMLKSLIDRQ